MPANHVQAPLLDSGKLDLQDDSPASCDRPQARIPHNVSFSFFWQGHFGSYFILVACQYGRPGHVIQCTSFSPPWQKLLMQVASSRMSSIAENRTEQHLPPTHTSAFHVTRSSSQKPLKRSMPRHDIPLLERDLANGTDQVLKAPLPSPRGTSRWPRLPAALRKQLRPPT